jgi:hypothetical protein
MRTIHVRPGEGQHYGMIDGEHIAKVAVQDPPEPLRSSR